LVALSAVALLLTGKRRRPIRVAFACAASLSLLASPGASLAAVSTYRAGSPVPAALTTAPRCFGAASRDPKRPCRNPALDSMVAPAPSIAMSLPESPCNPVVDNPLLDLCTFGADPAGASRQVALLGDSHAMQYRAAVDVVAQAKGWLGYSLALGGCPYSATTRAVVNEPLLSKCIGRNTAVPDWFVRHPAVDTVFVGQISGVPFRLPRGRDQFEGQVAAYISAWSALPASVTHVIVIRDSPRAHMTTRACIARAVRRGERAGRACRISRAFALRRDPAVAAANRIGSPRVQVVDLTHYFCDRRWCYPVVGGALVMRDSNHLMPSFVATLGPYLLDQVDRLAARWVMPATRIHEPRGR
jgi:hypothetical protein